MRRRLAALLWLTCATVPAWAVQIALTPRDITEAVSIGQSRPARELARLHEPYRLRVGTPPVDYLDVITPFRRIVLAAQAAERSGVRSFGQRDAMALLAPAPADVEFRVELTFHPLNTYVGVPAYTVWLHGAGGNRVRPRALERLPRYGARVEDTPSPLPVPVGPPLPGGSQPMLGGAVAAHFDGRVLDPTGVYDVVIEESGKTLARVRADLGTMR